MGEVSVDASPMVAMSVTGGGRVAVLSGLKPSDQHVSMMTVDLSGKRSEKSQTAVGEEGNGGGGGGGGGGGEKDQGAQTDEKNGTEGKQVDGTPQVKKKTGGTTKSDGLFGPVLYRQSPGA